MKRTLFVACVLLGMAVTAHAHLSTSLLAFSADTYLFGSEYLEATSTDPVVQDSQPLTPQQVQEVQAHINRLRNAGYILEANRLQAALNAGKIRMGDPLQMGRHPAMATDDGYLIINEGWYNQQKRTRGGNVVISSMLLHEGLHLRQWDDLRAVLSRNPGVMYDPDAMETDAYEMQIRYLEQVYNQSQSPTVKAYVKKVLDFLKARKAFYESQMGTRIRKPRPSMKFIDYMIEVIDTSPVVMSNTNSNFEPNMPGGTTNPTPPPTPAPTGMTQYASYYPQNPGTVPEGGSQSDFLDREASNRTINWAGIDEALPLAFGDRLYTAAGTFPIYDSKTWTTTQYQAALGSTLDAIDLEEIDVIRNLDFRVRTNPAVVGKTLAQVATGIPLFLVESTDPTLVSYGYDKTGAFIRLTPPTP